MFSRMMNGSGNTTSNQTEKATVLPSTPAVRVLQRRTQAKWEHSPIVVAMLTGNTLQSCEQMESMLEECQRSHSDDLICKVAARQYAMCIRMPLERDQKD
jgi:hypothetical protein